MKHYILNIYKNAFAKKVKIKMTNKNSGKIEHDTRKQKNVAMQDCD